MFCSVVGEYVGNKGFSRTNKERRCAAKLNSLSGGNEEKEYPTRLARKVLGG
jgi:hypothetical protein